MAISTPAAAGPTTLAELNMALLRLTALTSLSRPTISTTNAWRAGMSTAVAQPSRKAST